MRPTRTLTGRRHACGRWQRAGDRPSRTTPQATGAASTPQGAVLMHAADSVAGGGGGDLVDPRALPPPTRTARCSTGAQYRRRSASSIRVVYPGRRPSGRLGAAFRVARRPGRPAGRLSGPFSESSAHGGPARTITRISDSDSTRIRGGPSSAVSKARPFDAAKMKLGQDRIGRLGHSPGICRAGLSASNRLGYDRLGRDCRGSDGLEYD